MKTTCTLLALSLSLTICPSTAQAQGRCTMNTIAGRYVFASTGASTIVLGVAPDTFHWNALYGPIAGVGVVDITREGTMDGQYWLVAGALNFGLAPLPWHATITLDGDCTGYWESDFGGALLRERFVVLDNGRELRAVTTDTAVPTGNWHTTAHRVTAPCKQHTLRGNYLIECKNLYQFPVPPPNIFGGAIHLRATFARGGDFTASIYGKVGPDNSGLEGFGHLTLNGDCTAEGTLTTPGFPIVNHARGVFFDGGRRGYWMPLANEMPDGTLVPHPYGFCVITRIDPR